ncbi:family 16 glycoside hydrolase [Streptomyces sp. NPDC007325]|uniref:family 16 glycoside hydrolase n=1 Tax=Streptomyces sp. NPDC007325 TaxID=3154588 RepID=UPI0033FFB778
MNQRLNRRYRRYAVGLALAGIVAGSWAPSAAALSAADLPEQIDGVTLRTFDIGAELHGICELKPGQTPNVERKVAGTIDFSTDADFGLNDHFISHVLANLKVPQDGEYGFRLISDDGSRLSIGGKRVVDHDGQHGSSPKDGTVHLTAGVHPLFAEHFDSSGQQQLTVQWKPPGASDFSPIPLSALTTDKAVGVTNPDRKYCTGGLDSPGDGLPLDRLNPNYKLTNLRPPGFEPQVSGMDWLPDGRMAITTWGGTDNLKGEVYLVDNVTGDTGPDKVTYKKIAEGLKEPMGIKYVDGKLYVSEKHQLTELNDHNGDWVADEKKAIATWPYGGNFHEFAFGLLYDKGSFYLNLSISINYGGRSTDPQPASGNRGTTLKIDKRTGKVTYLAGGLRTPNGIGLGPENGIFVNDNQGSWLPASKLVHIKKDRFFNHVTRYGDGSVGPYDSKPVTKPVLWLPQNEIANSPTTPLMLKRGPFAGQMVFGDVTYGGLQRANLEKVGGEYQGAVFRHTQGLESGVNRLTMGPDGAIYIGGLGSEGNWGQNGKLRFGLQKLELNGTNTFDIHSMRATRTGFVMKYTQPLSQETVDALAESYRVKQWRYSPAPEYGGPKVDEETLRVAKATVSDDRREVTLDIPGLRSDRVVHVHSPRPFASEGGEELWSTEAWYTLNTIPGVTERNVSLEAEEHKLKGGARIKVDHEGRLDMDHKGYSGHGYVDNFGTKGAEVTFHVDAVKKGQHDVGLRYANGPIPATGIRKLSLYVNGTKIKQTALPPTADWSTWATHTERLKLRKGLNTLTYRYDEGDDGHVNLDMLHVAPAGARINLFEDGSLAEWQQHGGDGKPTKVTWPVKEDGSFEVGSGDIRTKRGFGDHKLHVEFNVPKLPDGSAGQDRGNSGVYLQDRYEIQVLDSYGVPELTKNEAAAIYDQKPADVNAAKEPGTWQAYDIEYREAKYDAAGNKTANARVSVWWNGVLVHDDVEILRGTGGNYPEGPSTGSLRLQDHGNKVKFRNIWVEPLS